MKVRINDSKEAPSLSDLEEIMQDTAPTDLYPGEWSNYEDNLDFENLEMVYGDNTIMFNGYNALYELLSFDNLTEKAKVELSNDTLEWAKSFYEYDDVE